MDSQQEHGLIIASGTGGCTTPTPIGGFVNVFQPLTNIISEFDIVTSEKKPEFKATLVDNYF
jgi:hypothetical protein